MKSTIKKQGDTAISELAKTYEVVRDELADRIDSLAGRIDDFDARTLGNRAYTTTRQVRRMVEDRRGPVGSKVGNKIGSAIENRIEKRLRPRRRRLPIGFLVAAGVVGAVAYVLYDRGRRDRIQGHITQIGATAQDRIGPTVRSSVDGVMTRVKGTASADEQKLRAEVETAITGSASGRLPAGLQLAVEGRTVYLRGTVEPALADQAASAAQTIAGVAAVVNLTSAPQPAVATGLANGKPVTGRTAVPGPRETS